MDFRSIEIGDVFVIKRKPDKKNCPYINKKFIVKDFSKSTNFFYYIDNRTNNKCSCINCYNRNGEKIKMIGSEFIEVVERKIQYSRNLKLNQIL